MLRSLLLISALSLLCIGCAPTSHTQVEEGESVVPAMEEKAEESPSVSAGHEEVLTVEGVLEQAGISIYMEGTHHLLTDAGTLLILESSSHDLDAFLGERVSVTGPVRKTVEAGGRIMDIELIERLSIDAADEVPSTDEKPVDAPIEAMEAASASQENEGGEALEKVAEPSSSEATQVKTPSSSTASPATSSAAASPSTAVVAPDERSEKMAKDRTESGEWSQQYCSSHIGFCIPVHRNWWFKSFGATTTYLWHVELGPEEILELGDGPIVVNLVSGSIAAVGASEREVRTEGNYAVGFRSWTDNRHFEISGAASLSKAISYLTENLAVYDVQE